MRFTKVFLFLAITSLFFSCGKSKKELAADRLSMAQSLYEKGDTAQALLQADSVEILYREEVLQVEAAQKFRKKVYGDILFREQDELDTLNKKIAELQQNFITEKTDFDRYTQYIHKKQDAERRWNKSYIQVHLDEKGDLYISSNYYGEDWLDHTAIRVYDGDLQAKTKEIPLGNVFNHHSDFLNTKWEKVSYMNGADNGVINFIAQHADHNLKAVFLGKRYYYIIMESYDKQAVVDALQLSKALKRQAVLEKDMKLVKPKAE